MSMSGCGYYKVDALVGLIRFLDAGGQTTASQLAERYEVHVRTAERWLVDVERWVPVERIGRPAVYRRQRFDDPS